MRGLIDMGKNSKSRKQKQREAARKKNRKKNLKKYTTYALILIAIAGIIGVISLLSNQPPYVPQAQDSPQSNAQANITFLQFGCYTCPFTKQFNLQTVPVLMDEYENEVNFRLQTMPIRRNTGSALAGEAALCVFENEDYDTYQTYNTRLYQGPSSFTRTDLDNIASEVGADMTQFNTCMDERRYEEQINEWENEGRRAGITQTPTVFITNEETGSTARIDGSAQATVYRQAISRVSN